MKNYIIKIKKVKHVKRSLVVCIQCSNVEISIKTEAKKLEKALTVHHLYDNLIKQLKKRHKKTKNFFKKFLTPKVNTC